MYECGFGDCFRLREENLDDLYVDFGIHTSSWSGNDKINRFDGIIAEMEEDKDFLLTHYHDDHFNGAIYMATNTPHRFNNVYISDVWNMPESVYVTSLTLLRGIFTRSVILGENTIIDFLETICTRRSRIHFISRGVRFHNDQYIALWPERNCVARKAQRTFDNLYGKNYDNNVQYRLTKFGNEISIVFQNYQADRSVLFTGDFGKKRNWLFIENNRDGLVGMHNYYEVIKLPHHGTDSYYHSFVGRVQATSTLMIPNGYIKQNWYVSSIYKMDSVAIRNRTVCAHNISCLRCACPRGRCIYPNLYLDI